VVHRVRDYHLVDGMVSTQIIQKNLMVLFGLILETLLLEEKD